MVALPAICCHFWSVNATATLPDPSAQDLAAALEGTERLVRTWVGLCNDFRQRERREIIEQVPSPQRLSEYREELKWMIRMARALLNLVSDPDFPARRLVSEISGKLLQLEDSWESLNNPVTDAEADEILKAFPDETRAGRPA